MLLHISTLDESECLKLGEEVCFIQRALVSVDGDDLLPDVSGTILVLHLKECGSEVAVLENVGKKNFYRTLQMVRSLVDPSRIERDTTVQLQH